MDQNVTPGIHDGGNVLNVAVMKNLLIKSMAFLQYLYPQIFSFLSYLAIILELSFSIILEYPSLI